MFNICSIILKSDNGAKRISLFVYNIGTYISSVSFDFIYGFLPYLIHNGNFYGIKSLF